MPFKSEKQKKYLFAKKPEVAKKFMAHGSSHHSGKGTKARLETAAEKVMFGSKYSK